VQNETSKASSSAFDPRRAPEDLTLDSPGQYWNWNRSRFTTPSRAIEVKTYQEVQAIVRDEFRFPGPVLAVGSMHSVTNAIINDRGTLILLSGISSVLGLEGEGSGNVMVRVQAGCSLKALSFWLAERGYELAFQAEIGNATVGALCTGDSKDSVLDGPGYFSAYVHQITFVNGEGELISIDESSNPAELAELRCSFGLRGIVVECLIAVCKLKLICSRFSVHRFTRAEELCAAIQEKILENQAFQANLLLPELAAGFAERSLADEEMQQTPEMSSSADNFREGRQRFVQQGGLATKPSPPPLLIHYRWQLINDFAPVDESLPRLDFQLYEHDFPKLEEVLEETLGFVKSFQALHEFKPHGWALYVVRRGPKSAKPYGLYSGGTGTSIILDPYFSDPLDKHWREFCKQYNRFAIDILGARVSPVQTQWLSQGDFRISREMAHPRLTSKYYKDFLI
jgi:hypothetical protein